MFKQSSSRNHRSKGVKGKHVLQICLFVGVCFWLIYRVKHSHFTKKEFDEKDAKISSKEQIGDVLKLGRKDLHAHLEKVTKNEMHEVEEEEETGGEEEENKREEEEWEEEETEHETEEQEEENKHEVGDQEEEENKHEEEDQEEEENESVETDDGWAGGLFGDETWEAFPDGSIDEEKEREDEGDGKGSEGNEGEDKEGQVENEDSSEGQDHDEGSWNTHEAREIQYKADDASSAVTHDTHTISTHTEKLSSENSNENSQMNISEQENKSNSTKEVNRDQNNMVVGDDQMAENGTPLNVTANEEKRREISSSNSKDILRLNSTMKTESNDQSDASNNSRGVSSETSNNLIRVNTEIPGYLQNGTEIMLDSNQAQNATVGATGGEGSILKIVELELASNSTETSDRIQSDPNSTISTNIEDADDATGEFLNSSNHSELALSTKDTSSDTTAEAGDGSGFSMTTENTDATQNEMLDTNNRWGRTDESSGSSSTKETADAVQHDPIDSYDSSIHQDEKEVHTDLNTLLEIKTGGDNNEDATSLLEF